MVHTLPTLNPPRNNIAASPARAHLLRAQVIGAEEHILGRFAKSQNPILNPKSQTNETRDLGPTPTLQMCEPQALTPKSCIQKARVLKVRTCSVPR